MADNVGAYVGAGDVVVLVVTTIIDMLMMIFFFIIMLVLLVMIGQGNRGSVGGAMVTKDEAVVRQLVAAVTLYAEAADPLAIFALASGPFAILKDISKVRYARIAAERDRLIQEGRVDDLLRASASYTARESHSSAMLDVASLQFQLGYPSAKTFWTAFNAKFNFLKHADEGRGGEAETLAHDIELQEAETLLLICVIALGELGFASRPALGLYHDHCFAQRGLFDRCQGHRFHVGYDKLPFSDRLEALRRALDLMGQGTPVAVVG